MGAPYGNCNAAKNKTSCYAQKGWYSKSQSKKYLKSIKMRGRIVTDMPAKQARVYLARIKREIKMLNKRK